LCGFRRGWPPGRKCACRLTGAEDRKHFAHWLARTGVPGLACGGAATGCFLAAAEAIMIWGSLGFGSMVLGALQSLIPRLISSLPLNTL
jgi:hypothetical protein